MLDHLLEVLRDYQFRYADEADLQHGVALVLDTNEIEYSREVILSPRDRVDFMVGDIALEIKVDGTLNQVTRQVHRYAQLDDVGAIVLLTTRSRHRNMPGTLNGKPLHVVWLSSL